MKSFGATVGVEGRRAMLLLFCGVAFAAALTRIEPVQAQDRGEVPIGTFNLQTPADSAPSGFFLEWRKPGSGNSRRQRGELMVPAALRFLVARAL